MGTHSPDGEAQAPAQVISGEAAEATGGAAAGTPVSPRAVASSSSGGRAGAVARTTSEYGRMAQFGVGPERGRISVRGSAPPRGRGSEGRPATLWGAFWNTVALSAVPFALVMGYVFCWPVELDPARWSPAFNPDLSGPYVSNDALTRARLLPVHWVERARRESQRYVGMGPETVAVGRDGWLYTGLCDAESAPGEPGRFHCHAGPGAQGWVVRVHPRTGRVERFVQTGGRPLGLAFDRQDRLYIADGTRGLLRVEPALSALTPLELERGRSAGGELPRHARLVATCQLPEDLPGWHRQVPRGEAPTRYASAEERRLEPGLQPYYTDSVATAWNPAMGREEVWFTCPSQRWPLEQIHLDGLESRGTGRVLRYRPCNAPNPLDCGTELIADGLMFANGLALSPRADAAWVSEWYGYRILQLTPPPGGAGPWAQSTFIDNLPGYPDNLTLDGDGTLWVGLVIRRLAVVDRFHPHPLLKKILARLPGSAAVTRHAFAIGLSPQGRLVHNLQDATGFFDQVTGVYPVGDALYFASNTSQALACLPRAALRSGFRPPGPGEWLSPDPCAGPVRLRLRQEPEAPDAPQADAFETGYGGVTGWAAPALGQGMSRSGHAP